MDDRHQTDCDPGANPVKGRGAQSNPASRFDQQTVVTIDDGWYQEPGSPTIRTLTVQDKTRTIISTNRSPDIPFEQSVNPYRGCEHGCIYCYARPTHAYWGLSPGLDFETRIIIKPGAANLLRETLMKPGYVCKPICIGANTDPYQPLEAELGTTRSLLEVLVEFEHPFSIITRSGLIRRDIDLLAAAAEKNICSVAVSVTTLDADLKRIMEPRAPTCRSRLAAIRSLTDRGIRTSMMVAPVIPFINDHEIDSILSAGREAGAQSANYILLRLPREVRELFEQWLQVHFPDRASRVMNAIRSTREGEAYKSEFGTRMRGTGEFASLLAQRFALACRQAGFEYDTRFELDTERFNRPFRQLSLL
ncbi:MAG: PA0069 family radical SAM protein [Proteobacteria bacterium]|nr:PA0069 family radical SAM protein [Pseudomonadota bacterium]MDA1300017.1 PA0069 family radical SAM protein [Pseudomonadota bacterium]